MRLHEILNLEPLRTAHAVAGTAGLNRPVTWVHIVDHPNPGPWMLRNQFLLATGYSWSKKDDDLRSLVVDLDERGVAGIGLAVPRYFDHAPSALRDEADQRDFPIIEIPRQIPFSTITESIHLAIVDEQQSITRQSEAIHRALTRAAVEAQSLDHLMLIFARLIDRSVMLSDAEGHIISWHARRSSAPGQAAQSIPPDRIIESLQARGYWQLIERQHDPIRVPAAPTVPLEPQVMCPVRLKDELVGVVAVSEGDEELTDLDLRATEHAATIAALQIARDREVASVEARLGHTFTDTLLEGRFEESPQSFERAVRHGFHTDHRYRVSLIILDESVPLTKEGFLQRERLVGRIQRRIIDRGRAPLLSVSLNQVTLVTDEEIDIEDLISQLGTDNLTTCVGRVHTGLSGVRLSYLEARSLRPWARPGKLVNYDELLIPRLLKGDVSAREAFVEDLIGPLRRAKNQTILQETLLALAASGFHYANAAATLCIHPKTMQYRVNRLESIMNVDLRDPEVRFKLELLSRVLDLNRREKESSHPFPI